MMIMLSEIAEYVNGELHGDDLAVSSVSIDTRTLKKNDLYIGIKGNQFDGNAFIQNAESAGAGSVILQEGFTSHLPYISVTDTRIALGKLANLWRNKCTVKIVGITGSNGKTTVKEMTAAILSNADSTLFTQGNLNNDIGVPLTLLRINENHRFAVIEMGANHLGEIAYTCQIADPDIVILNNAGAAHIEGFGSLDGVAQGKGEIVSHLKNTGTAVLNKDDRYYEYWEKLAGNRRIITFGASSGADVCSKNISCEVIDQEFRTTFDLCFSGKTIQIMLNLAGQHNVQNALAAACAGLALGLDLTQIKQGLESVMPVKGRLQPRLGHSGNIVIDDTYNANATSLSAGIDVLVACQGEPWVVLGAFGELGPESPAMHREIGERIKSKGVVRLLAVGSDAKNAVDGFGKGATFFNSQDELISELNKEIKGVEAILVKGSRLQQMENVVAALVDKQRT